MPKRVLIVDDDDDLFFLAEKYLKKGSREIELVLAPSGQDALQILEGGKIDAVFCESDLSKTSMGGLELLQWIRNHDAEIPFILFTDSSTQAKAIRALNMRADFYLRKDAEDQESLFEQLNKHIESFVEHRAMETALKEAKEELEKRVAKKTEQLQRMNSLLEAEIVQKEHAEQALLESQERLELALWGADLGLWIWDLESGETVYNERWAEMLGYRLDEIVQSEETWRSLVHPDDLDKAMNLWREHIEGRRDVYEVVYRMRTKDGRWRWVLDRGKVYMRRENGSPVKAAGTHLDVTDSMRREEKLREVTRRQAQRDSRHLTQVCNAVVERLERIRSAIQKTDEKSRSEIQAILDEIEETIDRGMRSVPSSSKG